MLKKLLVLTSIATISLFANTTLEIKNDGGDTHTVLLKDGDHSLAVNKNWIAIIKKGDERIGKNVKLWAYADINNENFDLSVGGNYYWFFRDLSKIEDGVQYEAVMFSNDSYKVITSMDMSRR
jgi:hypothetical protein